MLRNVSSLKILIFIPLATSTAVRPRFRTALPDRRGRLLRQGVPPQAPSFRENREGLAASSPSRSLPQLPREPWHLPSPLFGMQHAPHPRRGTSFQSPARGRSESCA